MMLPDSFPEIYELPTFPQFTNSKRNLDHFFMNRMKEKKNNSTK
jgi:hypothetical protein